ncbi:MAG: Nuclear protein SET [uncultured bacterium (gcode 4)]|uniref:Nuclear protein SET n=1 Tax=uncultured bacterium (gcode 4) TaxID=1234023 RepID=K1XJB0_9BACT|nr:MAG: Nuclear protein SET [uncultured bacterium (gcode 4)]
MYLIPKQNYFSPKAEIRPATIHGKGIFAKEPIKAGETVIIRWWDGYTDKAWAEQAQKEWKLVMQRDDDLFSIEDRGDDDGYFVNHSCDGNLRMTEAFTLAARRDINKDEEITADYALWEWDENYLSKWECRCGSEHCRKRITGKDYQLKEIQQRYLGHFSPLINKRIASQR